MAPPRSVEPHSEVVGPHGTKITGFSPEYQKKVLSEKFLGDILRNCMASDRNVVSGSARGAYRRHPVAIKTKTGLGQWTEQAKTATVGFRTVLTNNTALNNHSKGKGFPLQA